MKKTKDFGWVIFKYEESKLMTPEFFRTEEEAKKRFEKLRRFLKDCADYDIDEWDENGGEEIALLSADSIYRLGYVEFEKGSEEIFLYCDMENSEYFQIGHYDCSSKEDDVIESFRDFLSDIEERMEEDKEEGSRYKYSHEEDIENSFMSVYFDTDNDKCGFGEHQAMVCKISITDEALKEAKERIETKRVDDWSTDERNVLNKLLTLAGMYDIAATEIGFCYGRDGKFDAEIDTKHVIHSLTGNLSVEQTCNLSDDEKIAFMQLVMRIFA